MFSDWLFRQVKKSTQLMKSGSSLLPWIVPVALFPFVMLGTICVSKDYRGYAMLGLLLSPILYPIALVVTMGGGLGSIVVGGLGTVLLGGLGLVSRGFENLFGLRRIRLNPPVIRMVPPARPVNRVVVRNEEAKLLPAPQAARNAPQVRSSTVIIRALPRPSSMAPEELKIDPCQQLYNIYFPENRKAPHLLRGPLTPEQIKIITRELTPQTQPLFDAALEDASISMDTMRIPVVLRANGRGYDFYSLSQLAEDKNNYRETPEERIKFKLEDVIPHNTIATALNFLLANLEQGVPPDNNMLVNITLLRAVQNSQVSPSGPVTITSEQQTQLESFVTHLTDRQQKIFNIMCRDPLTALIIQRPVILPDGFTYDEKTMQAYCQMGENRGQATWKCPMNPEVTFTQQDILYCRSIENVLENVKKCMTVMQSQVADAPRMQMNR